MPVDRFYAECKEPATVFYISVQLRCWRVFDRNLQGHDDEGPSRSVLPAARPFVFETRSMQMSARQGVGVHDGHFVRHTTWPARIPLDPTSAPCHH